MMGPMPALDLAQDVFDIVRHAFRSGVKVLNLYYIKFYNNEYVTPHQCWRDRNPYFKMTTNV
jgi:hypothetical protein